MTPAPATPPAPAAAHGWWDRLPPAAGTAVMATGIVSVGFDLVGRDVLSAVLFAATAALWLLLAAAFALTLLRDRRQWTVRAATPPALTGVAATCVLGARVALAGRTETAAVLLAAAALAWPFLLAAVLRHWKHHMPGAVFLVCVSTQGLAVLAAILAVVGEGGAALAHPALALFCLGLVLYAAAFLRFDLRQVLTGAGDHWVAAGTLAISALAGAKLLAWPHWPPGVADVLRTATDVLLALALAGYLVLLVAEARHPRLRYDLRRWATVFPLGMTAVAALSTATVDHRDGLHTLGEVLLWIAAGAWLLTAAAFLRNATAHRRPPPARDPDAITRPDSGPDRRTDRRPGP